ncbi:DUF6415 family natural product biosynthesis protein [Streptomyces inhibens]|uniref:DUF6415 family natural product biosynthesis protein n=1 Tax=Streptomyces inhibens TaxID=2293571 RepID=UPI00402AD6A7
MTTNHTERQAGGTVTAADEPDAIDVSTIEETIARAQVLRGRAPDTGELGDLEELLRGHIALLLPKARQSARGLCHGSIEAHRLTARLDGIERQTRLGLGSGALSAHVQIHQLARDCQWLLAQHAAEARR